MDWIWNKPVSGVKLANMEVIINILLNGSAKIKCVQLPIVTVSVPFCEKAQ